jgi:alanine racemase
MLPNVWLEISKTAIKTNLSIIQKSVDEQVILAPVVKANAYGHGLFEMVEILRDTSIDHLCVNDLAELRGLRECGLYGWVLVMGYIAKEDLGELLDLDGRMMFSHREYLDTLNQEAELRNRKAYVHLKVDTGMSRFGISPEEVVAVLNEIKEKYPNVEIEGIATHFATADEVQDDSGVFAKQKESFEKLLNDLKQQNLCPAFIHCANSAGCLFKTYELSFANLARPGIGVYGYSPNAQKSDLVPALSWKTKVGMVKNLRKGDIVGYGASFTAPQDMRIAVLPVGYYDGLDRGLSNCGEVLVHGQRCPIVGKVCMDIIMVDVSAVGLVQQDDEVVLIGTQGEETITADDIASKIDTISYEILTNLRESMQRKIID